MGTEWRLRTVVFLVHQLSPGRESLSRILQPVLVKLRRGRLLRPMVEETIPTLMKRRNLMGDTIREVRGVIRQMEDQVLDLCTSTRLPCSQGRWNLTLYLLLLWSRRDLILMKVTKVLGVVGVILAQ